MKAIFFLALSLLGTLVQAEVPYPDCPNPNATCVSFGIDFQNDGSYFQVNNTDPFTFVSQFQGCQMDVAQNLLVDPYGDETLCSNTTLTPDNTSQLSTCDIQKDQLSNGQWSVLVISNNGKCAPIAYERDFSLSVGQQSSSVVTPTVTFTSTFTPVVYSTSTITTTSTVTAAPSTTITQASTYYSSTVTVTPKANTVYSTTCLTTFTAIQWRFAVSPTTLTKTATCVRLTERAIDKWATITPTMVLAQALYSAPAYVDRRIPIGRDSLRERTERLEMPRKLKKRAPDSATITVTETNTSLFVTSIQTVTGTTLTSVTTTEQTITITSTPCPSTTFIGVTISQTTVIAAAPTLTQTRTLPVSIMWVGSTKTASPTVTRTMIPNVLSTSCRAHGGSLA